MADTDIEWATKVWNFVRGCALISPGCTNCYAMTQAAGPYLGQPGQAYHGLTRKRDKGGAVWTGEVRFVVEKLADPLRWRKPERVFVNSMSDLFHEGVTDEQIAAGFGVMAACPQHQFLILTKRPERMRAWFEWVQAEWERERRSPSYSERSTQSDIALAAAIGAGLPGGKRGITVNLTTPAWPLSNVWIGVSVEDQQRADERIPHLLATPAAVRWLSVEPLLGPVDLNVSRTLGASDEEITEEDDALGPPLGGVDGIDWVVVGGESGPGARPCDLAWIRSVVEQCKAAGVPVFVKQVGAAPLVEMGEQEPPRRVRQWSSGLAQRLVYDLKDRKGGDMAEWPAGLRVREFPVRP